MPKWTQKVIIAIINALSKIKVCRSSCCSSECIKEDEACGNPHEEKIL